MALRTFNQAPYYQATYYQAYNYNVISYQDRRVTLIPTVGRWAFVSEVILVQS